MRKFLKTSFSIQNTQVPLEESLKKNKQLLLRKHNTTNIKKFFQIFSEEDFDLLNKYSDLFDLIIIGILNPNFPFNLRNEEILLKELEYYNLTNFEAVAEIGAGNGCFSLLMFFSNPNINLIVNEINISMYKYFKKRFKLLSSQFNLNNITSTFGTSKKTRIRKKVDKIIIRKSFHHFSKKLKMLNEIQKDLNTNGILFIQEYLKSPDNLNECSMLMSEEEILSSIPSHLFELKETKRLESKTIFKFIKI